MSLARGELGTVDLIEGTRALQRRWKLLAAAAVLGGALGVSGALLVSPVWECEANLEIGVLPGGPLENAGVVASLLESVAFRRLAESDVQVTSAVRIVVQGVQPGGDGSVAYVRVLARSGTPDEARAVAAYAVDYVRERHAGLFEAAVREHTAYVQALTRSVENLESGISQLELGLAHARRDMRDAAVALLLIQAQLESRRTQQVQLVKELRDARLAEAGMRPSNAIGAPSVARNPVWPRRLLFAVLGAAVGLLAGLLGILGGALRAVPQPPRLSD